LDPQKTDCSTSAQLHTQTDADNSILGSQTWH